MSIENEALKMLAENYRSRLELLANLREPQAPLQLNEEEAVAFRAGASAMRRLLTEAFGDIARDERELHKKCINCTAKRKTSEGDQ